MCDEIAIINHGQLITRDTTANLLGRLDSKTMVITPAAETAIPDLPAGITAATRKDGSLAFTYKPRETSAEEVLAVVHNAGIRIADVKTEEADLEDVFLALTSNK